MKKLLVVLDEDSSKVLDKFPNKSAAIREAVKIYNEHISTDTLTSMGNAFRTLLTKFEKMETEFQTMYMKVDAMEMKMDRITGGAGVNWGA